MSGEATPRAIPSTPGTDVARGNGGLVTYRFTSLSPTILNCQVLDPHNETRFWVVTEAGVPSCTLLKNPMGAKVALINWQTAPPQIDLPGLVTRQPAAQWLCLTPDRGSVTDKHLFQLSDQMLIPQLPPYGLQRYLLFLDAFRQRSPCTSIFHCLFGMVTALKSAIYVGEPCVPRQNFDGSRSCGA